MSRKSRVVTLAVLALAAMGAYSAVALGAVSQTLTAAVSPNKAGTKKAPKNIKLTITVATGTTDGTKPPTTNATTVYLPKDIVLNSSKLASCTLDQLNAGSETGAACKKAKVGTGTATAFVPPGLTENLVVTAFNGNKGKQLLLFVRGSSPVTLAKGFAGTLATSDIAGFGKKLVFQVPTDLQQPVPNLFVPLTKFSVAIKATAKVKKGKKTTSVPYVGLQSCPKSKALTFGSVTTYAAGSGYGGLPVAAAKATAQVACK